MLDIPDEVLWETREKMRGYMYHFVRERIRERWVHENVPAARVLAGGTLLGQQALTIGFARRFAAYKRPDLIFQDPDRLPRLLNDPKRPVQFVFAGKAHPADDGGKQPSRASSTRADPRFGGRIAFVEDYDVNVARYLVQGCDVWLNNPRKPLEASGTSGMKAAANGVLNVSIGDGWWPEGFVAGNGWLIDPATSTRTTPPRTRPTPKRSTACSRTRSCRPSTSGTPRGAASLGADGQAVHPYRRATILHTPHVEGIRRADVPAGVRGQPHEQVGQHGRGRATIGGCLVVPSPACDVLFAMRRTSPSPEARRSTAATAGTRK